MNILHHKKWHVRTKENVARVKRDEAKAEAEEKARAERAAIAENEDRVRRLKMRGGAGPSTTVESVSDIFGPSLASSSAVDEGTTTVAASGHVNFFADLELQERKNLGVGNKEYAAEKKKEQDDWESKMGIMKRFAEDTKEYAKERNWWEEIPLVREPVEKLVPKSATAAQPSTSTLRPTPVVVVAKGKRKHKNESKKEKRKRRRRSSSSSTSSRDSTNGQSSAKKQETKLAKLRAERLERERREQLKAKELLAPKKVPVEAMKPKPSKLAEDRERKYNSQFNPEFARR